DDVRDFNHTVINPDFRGQGLSSPLIKAALDETREAGLKAVASCSAVQHFVSKNPEYEDLIRRYPQRAKEEAMSSEEKNIQVTHDAENTKFVLTVDGQEAGA